MTEKHQINAILFNEWFERVQEDGMFEEEYEGDYDECDFLGGISDRISYISQPQVK